MKSQKPPRSLREARSKANLTQDRLAKKLGLTRVAVSHWEVGRAVPNGSSRLLLALTLDCAPSTVNSWFPERVAA